MNLPSLRPLTPEQIAGLKALSPGAGPIAKFADRRAPWLVVIALGALVASFAACFGVWWHWSSSPFLLLLSSVVALVAGVGNGIAFGFTVKFHSYKKGRKIDSFTFTFLVPTVFGLVGLVKWANLVGIFK
jgi:hypothetical protein